MLSYNLTSTNSVVFVLSCIEKTTYRNRVSTWFPELFPSLQKTSVVFVLFSCGFERWERPGFQVPPVTPFL